MCFFNSKSSFLLELLLDMWWSFYIHPPYASISLSYFYLLVPKYFIFGDFFSSSLHFYKSCLQSIPLRIFFLTCASFLFQWLHFSLRISTCFSFFVPSLSSFIIVCICLKVGGEERDRNLHLK